MDSYHRHTIARPGNIHVPRNAHGNAGAVVHHHRVVDLVRRGDDLELIFHCLCVDVARNHRHDFLVFHHQKFFDLAVACVQAVVRVDVVQSHPRGVKAQALRCVVLHWTASDAVVQLEVEVPRERGQVTVVLLHAAEAEVLVLRCVEVGQAQHAVLVQRVEQVVLWRAVLARHVEERRVVEVEPHVRAVLLRRRLVSSRRPQERLRAQTFASKISLGRAQGGNAGEGVLLCPTPQK